MPAGPDALVELEGLIGAELFSANNFAGAPVWLAERYPLLEVRRRGARGLVVKARDTSIRSPRRRWSRRFRARPSPSESLSVARLPLSTTPYSDLLKVCRSTEDVFGDAHHGGP